MTNKLHVNDLAFVRQQVEQNGSCSFPVAHEGELISITFTDILEGVVVGKVDGYEKSHASLETDGTLLVFLTNVD